MNTLDRRILGGHIKTVREACGEDYSQFARRLNVSIPMVISFENCTMRPSLTVTTKLYEAALAGNQPELAAYFKDREQGLRDWLAPIQHYRESTGGKS